MSTQLPYRFPFAKYPAVRIALLLIAGIITACHTAASFGFWLCALAFIIIATLWAEYAHNKTMRPGPFYLLTGCYLCGVMIAGAFWQTAIGNREAPASARLLTAYTWQQVEVKGTVTSIRQSTSGKFQLDIKVDTTLIPDSLLWLEPYRLRTIYDPESRPLPAAVQPGRRIHAGATVYPLQGKSNPYEFDYRRYLVSQGIYAQAGIDTLYSIDATNTRLSWNRLRHSFLSLIDQNFSEQTVALAKALLIGYKNELAREDKIAFSRTGLSHIMAVSGLHVGFILAPFWFIIPFFWTFRRGKQIGLVLLLVLLLGYAGLTGFSASVVRASITGGLITYGRLFHKARDSINLTAIAAIIILLFNPNQLFEIGFQLSFAAVYIILLTLPVLQQIIPARLRYRWYGAPIMVVLVSVAVQLGLYPLLSFYFGEFSLAGPAANALVIPALTIIVPFALFLLPVSAVFPSAGYLLNAPCRWFLDFLQWFVTEASGWSWSWVQTPSVSIFTFLIWAAAIAGIASLSVARLRWKVLVLFLGLLCLQQGTRFYQHVQLPELQITMLDVGQGDAVHIKTPAGRHLLIDAGRWTPDYNSARYVILPHLKALGVQKLDAVFLSHPHADHIGGILELIQEIEIDTIYNSGFAYESKLYQSYIREAHLNNIPVRSLRAGDAVPVDPAIRLLAYGPAEENYHTDPNERSLILELIYGQTEFLFTGDGGAPQETLILGNYGSMIDTDFLKVGHHGSRTASSQAFLAVATPAIAAVSLAKNNRFSHPHIEAVRNLQQSGAALHYTGLEGALQFSSDGQSIKRITWR